MGQLDDALEAYNTALQINPDIATFYNKGNLYFTLEKYHDAIASYEQALEI